MTLDEVLSILRKRIERAGSQHAFAKQAGVSVPYVNDVLHRRRAPGPAICKALGVKRHTTYSVSYNFEPDGAAS